MNPWLNLLVSSLLSGFAVGWASVVGGATPKGAVGTGISAALAALVQHVRQTPDLGA